jgi:CHAT domain-containing protein
VLSNMGTAHYLLGHADLALAYHAQSLVTRHELRDRKEEGRTLANIGLTHQALGRGDSALVYLTKALSINREIRDRRGESATLHNIGLLYNGWGYPDSALIYYTRSLRIALEEGDHGGVGGTLGNIGSVHQNLGHPDSALAYYAQALSISRTTGDRRGEGAALAGIGLVYEALGRADSALAYQTMTLTIQRQFGDRRAEGSALNNIGSVYHGLRNVDSAWVYYARALNISREVGNRRGEGALNNNIGQLHQDLGRTDSALVYYARALAIQREMKDRRSESATLNNIGWTYHLLGRADSALVYYAAALSIQREGGDRTGEGATLSNIGSAHHYIQASRDLARAVAYYDSSAAIIANVGLSAGRDQNRLSFAEQNVGMFYAWPLGWLARAPEANVGERDAASAALAASERGRAQALRELMGRNAADTLDAPAGGCAHTCPGADLPAEGRALASDVTRGGVPALSYLVTRDTLLAFLLLPDREVEVFRTAVTQDTLAAFIRGLRAGLEAGSDAWRAPAARLSAMLLPTELLARLPESGELVIVPAGPLFLLPFAALPLSGDAEQSATSFFGLRYAIRYSPSLQVLADLEAQPSRSRPAANPLVVGNPTMPWIPTEDGSTFQLSSLEGAEVQARQLAGRLGTTLLSGGDATEASLRARLATATLVHLGTHGYAYTSDARARDTYVALAPGAGHDGLLTVGEVLDEVPRMRAELVVLSACETGLGDLKQAEGTVGLQRAFLARGARGVLVSLWNVGDGNETGLLMERFYTHWLAGDTRAEALRKAQVAVAESPDFHHPRYWAAFQIAGAR